MGSIKIRSKRDGFRRCGIPHFVDWTIHPDGSFTDEEIAILRAEPMLEVVATGLKSGQRKKGGKNK